MHFCEHKLLRHVLKAPLKDLLDSYNICVRGSQCFYVKENDEYGDAIPPCDYNLYYLCGRSSPLATLILILTLGEQKRFSRKVSKYLPDFKKV